MYFLVILMHKTVAKTFIRLKKYKYMFLSVGIELPISEVNGHVFLYLISNVDLF